EVQVPAQDDVDQENVTEEIVDNVAQPTSPLPPSPQVLDKCFALVLRVEGLETANTAQQLEILKLKARVKKLERLNKVVAATTHVPTAKPIVVDVSTTISAAKPAAKPKVLKIVAAALAVSIRKRKGVYKAYEEEILNTNGCRSREEMEKEEEEIIKSINETPVQKAAKRRRLREQAKED
nr:hypothetical protein [Tanacetum cinerariifolium]